MSDHEFAENLLENLFTIWITPAIERGREAGSIDEDFSLVAAQIVFKPQGGKPLVRLNNEVQGYMEVKTRDNVETQAQAGDPVDFRHIEKIEKFELPDEERDFGHATIIRSASNWFIFFDFIYNKNTSLKHAEAANEFAHAAAASIEKNYLRAAIDNLHSASELAAKAYLLGSQNKRVMTAKSHDVLHTGINQQRKLGNVPEDYVRVFNKLSQLRESARYLKRDMDITLDELLAMHKEVEQFVVHVAQFSKSQMGV